MFGTSLSTEILYGTDACFAAVSVVVTLLIALSAHKLYKFAGEKRYEYFAYSFAAIALALAAKIFTNVAIYYDVLEQQSLGLITLQFENVFTNQVHTLYALLAYRLLMLFGLLGIFHVVGRTARRRNILLSAYFVLIVSLFSVSTYYVFHITAALLLAYIALHFYQNYQKQRTSQSLAVLSAFAAILAGQLVFLFISFSGYLYVAAECIQLLGYLLLLYSYLRLNSTDGRKKNKG